MWHNRRVLKIIPGSFKHWPENIQKKLLLVCINFDLPDYKLRGLTNRYTCILCNEYYISKIISTEFYHHFPSISLKIIDALNKAHTKGNSVTLKIVAASRGMHVSPAKQSYMWLPRKCDRRTDRRAEGQTPDKVIPMCCYPSQATQKHGILYSKQHCFSLRKI